MLDLFQKESIKFSVCKNILEKYRLLCTNDDDDVDETATINDPVTISSFMCIAKVLNDGVK